MYAYIYKSKVKAYADWCDRMTAASRTIEHTIRETLTYSPWINIPL